MAENGKFGTINLTTYDSIFSTEEERQEAKLEKVQEIPVSELFPFKEHPFQVRDDEEMDKLVETVKIHVNIPLLARPRPEGGYEIISGHRRRRAAELAGIETLPVIVRELDDDEAIVEMVDSNCQREKVLPMEKARAYQMKLDALKRQGARTDLTSCQVGRKLEAAEMMAKKNPDSARQIHRFIALNGLIPELQTMVDDNKLKFNPAVELSYLPPAKQREFFDYIECQDCTPSLSQAQRLKTASKENNLTESKLEEIMVSKPSIPPREARLNITVQQIAKYFPQDYSEAQMVQQIIKLLEAHLRQKQRGGIER